ncbi:hypothetical protein A3Q56_01441 [Intoshia linei]|uniref:Uncharacterized protein n=1 Tax=Intoshia linei TaxID=1819745 RepID=A0A177BB14_9BILA|nr:hypothetical protein A3Q56_01441 [Intoshia linei]
MSMFSKIEKVDFKPIPASFPLPKSNSEADFLVLQNRIYHTFSSEWLINENRAYVFDIRLSTQFYIYGSRKYEISRNLTINEK